METFKPLELMEKKYSIDSQESLCKGDNAKIFRLDNERVVRIPYNPFNNILCNGRESQFNTFREYKRLKFIVESGIKYPKPEGVYAVQDINSGLYYPGLVMNHGRGESIDKLCGEELRIAKMERDLEIEKARNMGFKIKDNHGNNALWDKGEICLLDPGSIEIITEF